jgi:hypothetical protein
MCVSAFGRVILQGIFDVLAKRDSSIAVVSWLLGGISVRFFVAHALAAEAFIVAYPRLPTVRRFLERGMGTLTVGAALGTLMWVILRAMMPTSGPTLIGITLVSWLTMALFSGPIIVWIAREYLAAANTGGAAREARREIGYGLAVILPAVFVLIWTFGTEAGAGLMIGMVFVGIAALAVGAFGTSMLLGGIWKARGLNGQRWARATPLLIVLGLIILAMRVL